MKKRSIFAAFTARTKSFLIQSGKFFIACGATCINIGATDPHGLLDLSSDLFLPERGKVAFLIFKYFNFSFMARTMKNASMVNNSSHISTDSHETALLLISELNKLASTLSTKLSITINIIIGNNNITNSGIVCGDLAINSKNVLL